MPGIPYTGKPVLCELRVAYFDRRLVPVATTNG
jgi:hypothetical protein